MYCMHMHVPVMSICMRMGMWYARVRERENVHAQRYMHVHGRTCEMRVASRCSAEGSTITTCLMSGLVVSAWSASPTLTSQQYDSIGGPVGTGRRL